MTHVWGNSYVDGAGRPWISGNVMIAGVPASARPKEFLVDTGATKTVIDLANLQGLYPGASPTGGAGVNAPGVNPGAGFTGVDMSFPATNPDGTPALPHPVCRLKLTTEASNSGYVILGSDQRKATGCTLPGPFPIGGCYNNPEEFVGGLVKHNS